MDKQFYISTFYHFFDLCDLIDAKKRFKSIAESCEVEGIVIFASEGINATISAPSSALLENFKAQLQKEFCIVIDNFKDTVSLVRPFKRLMIKVRPEIVTTGIPGRVPLNEDNFHLSPQEWDHFLEGKKGEFVIIDTRNWYEYQLGSFEGALNPNIEKFTDFPQYFEEQKIDKKINVLIFCTGGIRCEKGILELQDQGYSSVFQLQGGIINYLKQRPLSKFRGECFVFDHRVAIDQNLRPSVQYKLCPHCGQPGNVEINCKHCDSDAIICHHCAASPVKKETCSKNCAYHYVRNPSKKGRKQHLPLRDRSQIKRPS